MKVLKNKTIQLVASAFAILIFGIFMGYQLSNANIKKIQGYLFNAVSHATSSNATNSNATNSNATNSNATNSNATNSNATNSNATNSNATNANASSANYLSTDNILYLVSFKIISTNVVAGEKVFLDFTTAGACLNGMMITFKDKINNDAFTATVRSIDDNPYIVLPSNLLPTSYEVTDILLTAKNSDNTTFSRIYSSDMGTSGIYWNFTDKINITTSETSVPIVLSGLGIEPKSGKVGERINLNLNVSEIVKSAKLIFKGTDNSQLVIYPKRDVNKWYFEIPSTASKGIYSLQSATFSSDSNTKIYSVDGANGSEMYNFDVTLEVVDVVSNVYIYNNEDISNDIIVNLYNSADGAEITINADSNTLITEEIFNAIKGKNKKLVINSNDNQIIFNGNNIIDSKTIDATINVDSIKDNDDINKLIDSGVVIRFADNGTLPGEATVRIKSTDEMDRILQNEKIYVYYFNDGENKFQLIATNIEKTEDGYYEFEITHNSDYVLVNKEIDRKLVVLGDDNIVRFQRSTIVNLLLIGMGIIIVIGVSIIIILLKNKNQKQQTTKK